MITQDLNLLPLVTRRHVRFLGTAKCSEAEPQCVSVGVLESDVGKGDLVLADQDGRVFRIPKDERLAILTLIVQSLDRPT